MSSKANMMSASTGRLEENHVITKISARAVDWEKVSVFDGDGYVAYVNIDKESVPDNFISYTVIDDGFFNPKRITKDAVNPFCTLLIAKDKAEKTPLNETDCYWFKDSAKEMKFSNRFYTMSQTGRMRKING